MTPELQKLLPILGIVISALSLLTTIGLFVIRWMLVKADKDRTAQTNVLHELKGATASHGERIRVAESRLDGHDRELGRLNNLNDSGRFLITGDRRKGS